MKVKYGLLISILIRCIRFRKYIIRIAPVILPQKFENQFCLMNLTENLLFWGVLNIWILRNSILNSLRNEKSVTEEFNFVKKNFKSQDREGFPYSTLIPLHKRGKYLVRRNVSGYDCIKRSIFQGGKRRIEGLIVSKKLSSKETWTTLWI